MNYIVKLPRNYEVDIFNLPEDFDEHIRNDFQEYTEGTSKEYRDCDRLGYIDRVVELFNRADYHDADIEVDELVKGRFEYKWYYDEELLNEDDIYCKEFMTDCFQEGIKLARLQSQYRTKDHHIYDELQKLLVRIIKIIMDWSEE